MYLSEYIIESVVNVGYYYNNSDGTNTKLFKLPPVDLSPFLIYTTELDAATLLALSTHGFPDGNKC